MADPKKNPLIGAFRTPLPGTPPDTPAPPKAGKPPAAGAATPIDKKKEREVTKASADTSAKPADGKKGPEALKTPADTPAKPADGKKEPEAPKVPADTPAKSADGKKPETAKAPADTPAKPTDEKKPENPKTPTGTTAKLADGKKGPEDSSTPADAPAKPTDAEKAPEAPIMEEPEDEELPKNLKIPLTKEGQPETVTTMKVANIRPFEGHPFAVRDNKDMWDLVDSIKKFGVLEPVMVIPHKDGGYEMVSGHRRMRACQLAEIEDIPVIVRNLDRDEAIISMVDSNLKREEISPMEKARAYQMKTDAMKRKMGRRTKEEKAQMEASGQKPMTADEELAKQMGESAATIQRYKTLNKLVPELQDMVDEGKMPVNTGADIAQMKPAEQKLLVDAIQKEDKVPSGTKAKELKEESKAGRLTAEKIEQAVAPQKREEPPLLKITLTEEDLRPYFPDKRTTIPDVKRGVFEALDLRKRAIERQKAKAEADKGVKKTDAPTR